MKKFDIYFFENHASSDGKCVCEEDGNRVVWYEDKDCYGKQIVPLGSDMVCTQVNFYPDTLTVMREGQYLKDWHEPIGIWKTYDRDGMVTEETDADKGYPVKWEEMKRILLENSININGIMRGWRQKTEEGRPEWRFQMKTSNLTMEIARFDAKNGSFIERKSIQLKRR